MMYTEPEPEDLAFPQPFVSRIPRIGQTKYRKNFENTRDGEENLDESRDEFNAFDLS